MLKIVEIESTDFFDTEGGFASLWEQPKQKDFIASFSVEVQISPSGSDVFYGNIMTGSHQDFTLPYNFNFIEFDPALVRRQIVDFITSCRGDHPSAIIDCLSTRLRWEFAHSRLSSP